MKLFISSSKKQTPGEPKIKQTESSECKQQTCCEQNLNNFGELPQISSVPQTSLRQGLIKRLRFNEKDNDEQNEKEALNTKGAVENQESSELAAVIVSIRDNASYDELFTTVQQKTKPGTHVHTYLVQDMNPNDILQLLKTESDQVREIENNWGRDAVQLYEDIASVEPESVVFNWECCGGCGDHGFACNVTPMPLMAYLLHQRSFMVMCSDFSLKALIKDWDANVLGANPFVQVGTFGDKLTLRFDNERLKKFEDSAQLQVLGELCDNGNAEIHALSSTIVYAVDSAVSTRDHPDSAKSIGWEALDVLTIVTELGGNRHDHYTQNKSYLSTIGRYCGLAGHCVLRFPSGGRLLASCPHWIELSKLDVSIEALLEVTSRRYGAAEMCAMEEEIAQMDVGARGQYARRKAKEYVQSSAPGKYSKSSYS